MKLAVVLEYGIQFTRNNTRVHVHGVNLKNSDYEIPVQEAIKEAIVNMERAESLGVMISKLQEVLDRFNIENIQHIILVPNAVSLFIIST